MVDDVNEDKENIRATISDAVVRIRAVLATCARDTPDDLRRPARAKALARKD